MANIDYNKYENYIRVGHNATQNIDGSWNCTDLVPFPTPSEIGRVLHDVDVDAYTDLRGYTQRNRVRNDVEEITLKYSILSDNDEAFILNKLQPVWIYVELIDKKTKQKKVHKMYASDKEWNVFKAWYDEQSGTFREETYDFTFSLVEQ